MENKKLKVYDIIYTILRTSVEGKVLGKGPLSFCKDFPRKFPSTFLD